MKKLRYLLFKTIRRILWHYGFVKARNDKLGRLVCIFYCSDDCSKLSFTGFESWLTEQQVMYILRLHGIGDAEGCRLIYQPEEKIKRRNETWPA